jgi:hypothetical protein
VSTRSGANAWGGGAVTLGWDGGSLTDCSLQPMPIGMASISFSSTSVMPSSTGDGALSTMTINTLGLAQGCYLFTLRAYGTNGDGQPVTHLETVRFTVATTVASGQYVDIIGWTVFEIDTITANDILGHAVTAVYADPGDPNLRRAQRARLVPWT